MKIRFEIVEPLQIVFHNLPESLQSEILSELEAERQTGEPLTFESVCNAVRRLKDGRN